MGGQGKSFLFLPLSPRGRWDGMLLVGITGWRKKVIVVGGETQRNNRDGPMVIEVLFPSDVWTLKFHGGYLWGQLKTVTY